MADRKKKQKERWVEIFLTVFNEIIFFFFIFLYLKILTLIFIILFLIIIVSKVYRDLMITIKFEQMKTWSNNGLCELLDMNCFKSPPFVPRTRSIYILSLSFLSFSLGLGLSERCTKNKKTKKKDSPTWLIVAKTISGSTVLPRLGLCAEAGNKIETPFTKRSFYQGEKKKKKYNHKNKKIKCWTVG